VVLLPLVQTAQSELHSGIARTDEEGHAMLKRERIYRDASYSTLGATRAEVFDYLV